jgi:hypothetical protein
LWNNLELTKKLGQRGKEFVVSYTESENYIRKLEHLFDKMRV